MKIECDICKRDVAFINEQEEKFIGPKLCIDCAEEFIRNEEKFQQIKDKSAITVLMGKITYKE